MRAIRHITHHLIQARRRGIDAERRRVPPAPYASRAKHVTRRCAHITTAGMRVKLREQHARNKPYNALSHPNAGARDRHRAIARTICAARKQSQARHAMMWPHHHSKSERGRERATRARYATQRIISYERGGAGSTPSDGAYLLRRTRKQPSTSCHDVGTPPRQMWAHHHGKSDRGREKATCATCA